MFIVACHPSLLLYSVSFIHVAGFVASAYGFCSSFLYLLFCCQSSGHVAFAALLLLFAPLLSASTVITVVCCDSVVLRAVPAFGVAFHSASMCWRDFSLRFVFSRSAAFRFAIVFA